MELKDYLNMGYEEQRANLDLSKLSNQDLIKALQENEDSDAIKQIISELEHRTDRQQQKDAVLSGVEKGLSTADSIDGTGVEEKAKPRYVKTKTLSYSALIVMILFGIGFVIYHKINEYKPVKELSIALTLEDGRFYVYSVVEKAKEKRDSYGTRLECRYFGDEYNSSVSDTLWGNVWPQRVLEMGSVFFGMMTTWDYYPKNDYGIQLPQVLQSVYHSKRSGNPIIDGYIPEVKLQITERMYLEFAVTDKRLSLIVDEDVIDGKTITSETDGLLNAVWTEKALEFLEGYN